MEFFKLYKGDNMINKFLEKIKKYRNDENITILELNSIIKINKECVLLDVRSPQEYEEGHLNRSN